MQIITSCLSSSSPFPQHTLSSSISLSVFFPVAVSGFLDSCHSFTLHHPLDRFEVCHCRRTSQSIERSEFGCPLTTLQDIRIRPFHNSLVWTDAGCFTGPRLVTIAAHQLTRRPLGCHWTQNGSRLQSGGATCLARLSV